MVVHGTPLTVSTDSQRGRVRTFDLVRPRHVRCQLRYTLKTESHSTHGWIRTTNDAINNRGLYRLSYMGISSGMGILPMSEEHGQDARATETAR